MATGGCLCGEVRFEVSGVLSAIELCHCPKCRRAYGAPFAATLYARADAFAWRAGAQRVKTWDAPLERTPPAYRHSFCERCGSPLPIVVEGVPWVEVPVSALDGDVAARVAYHQFSAQRAAWCEPPAAPKEFSAAAPPAEKVLRGVLV